MKPTNTGDQAAAFRTPVASVEVAYEVEGETYTPALVSRFAESATTGRREYGQWAAFRAWESGTNWTDALSAKDGVFFDPLLKAWINHPVYLKADHAILSSRDPISGRTIHAGAPSPGAFYGWHVLDRGMAVYEGENAALTSLVSGLNVGIWVTTEASEDDGFRALRQQAPAPRWSIESDPAHPLPHNPSFELMLRLDDLQLGGDEPAVPDPEAAYVAAVFGQGLYRILVTPRLEGGGSGKTKWTVALQRRQQDGWLTLLGAEELGDLKPETDGLLRIAVQCIEGRIIVRPDLYGEAGAVYTDRFGDNTVRRLHVPSGPLTIRGAYLTCRVLVERILYARRGFIVFPPVYPDYVSQSTEDLRVIVAGAEGVAEGAMPADQAPWLFTRLQYPADRNAWATVGWGFDPLQGFSATDALQVFVASPQQLDESTLLREIPPLQWAEAWGAGSDALLVALRMEAAEELVGGWGFGDSARTIMAETGAHTLAVTIIKLLWPPTLAPITRTWVPLATADHKGWDVSTSYDGQRLARAAGSLTLDDRALPGEDGPQADLHGRRLYRFNVGWKNETGTLWTTGHRYTLLGKGPSRSKGNATVALSDVLTLAKDVTGPPPPDGERPADYLAGLLLRAGIPASWHSLSQSGRRIPAPSPEKPDGHFKVTSEQTAYDLLLAVADWDEMQIVSAGETIHYRHPMAAPDSATIARAFHYSEGSGTGYRGAWPVQHANMTEPDADDREVTRILVTGDQSAGPVMAQARLVDRDREGDFTVVAGVGRRKELLLHEPQITSQGHAAAKARVHAERLWGDIGDYTVSIPTDPELRLFDVGQLTSHAHNLTADTWVEAVGISERVDASGMPTMQAQLRRTNRYAGPPE